MTTVEISDQDLARLKDAREIIQKRFNIKMRMPDMMSHLLTSPEEIVDIISRSINKKVEKKQG